MTAAAPIDPWVFRLIDLDRVVDGDTVFLRVEREVDTGFRRRTRLSTVEEFRLAMAHGGIDCPERKGPTKAMGEAARQRTELILQNAIADWPAELREVWSWGADDKYGRWLADALFSSTSGRPILSLCGQLLSEGYALPYDGKGPRPKWDPAVPYPLPLELRRPVDAGASLDEHPAAALPEGIYLPRSQCAVYSRALQHVLEDESALRDQRIRNAVHDLWMATLRPVIPSPATA